MQASILIYIFTCIKKNAEGKFFALLEEGGEQLSLPKVTPIAFAVHVHEVEIRTRCNNPAPYNKQHQ